MLDAFIIDAIRREEARRSEAKDRPRLHIEPSDEVEPQEREDEPSGEEVIRIDLQQSSC